eukprot:s1346_g12.t1
MSACRPIIGPKSPEFQTHQTPAGSQCHAPQMGHWLYVANKIILRNDWPTNSCGHSKNGMFPEPFLFHSFKDGEGIRFLLGIWGRVMNYKVRSAVMRYPWTSKEEVLFWRGGMTGKWICPHDGANCSALQEVSGKQWNLTHWHLGLRGRAVLLQSFAPPGYTDIKFSSRVGMSDEVAALLTRRGWLDLDEPHLMERQFRAKYLLVTDDSDRIYWMATGNSLLFLPSSGMLRGCGLRALKPWQHFIPLKPDLSDALERVAWAKAHDEEARVIAARGAALAREAFSHEAQLFCLLRMIQEVSAWLKD